MKKPYKNHSSHPSSIAPGINVEVQDGKFEKAMKIFTKKVNDSGILRKVRDRTNYIKPTTRRKQARQMARKRWLKKQIKDRPQPR